MMRGLARISSVSGGSITAGVLGSRWKELDFDAATGVARAFVAKVAEPIHELASTTVDVGAVLTGALLPGTRISDRVEAAYRKHLFGDRTLQDLPSDDEGPRFVINATSLQTGVLFRFSRPYMADYHVGKFLSPTVSLAKAVAASHPRLSRPSSLP
jgi:NTE family protein